MLDSFDVMLYAIVLANVMRDLHMTKGQAGMLTMSVTDIPFLPSELSRISSLS